MSDALLCQMVYCADTGGSPVGTRSLSAPLALAQRGLAEFPRAAGQRLPLAQAPQDRMGRYFLTSPTGLAHGPSALVHPRCSPVAGGWCRIWAIGHRLGFLGWSWLSEQPAKWPSALAMSPSSQEAHLWPIMGSRGAAVTLGDWRLAWAWAQGPDGRPKPCLPPWPLSFSSCF